MSFSMRCPKCGLIQAQRQTCKSCGTVVSGPPPGFSGPAAEIVKPAAPAEPSAPPLATLGEAPQAGAGVNPIRRLAFHGTGGSLSGIQAVNILLTLTTLGIYSCWAKVKVRSYLLSQTEFEGDRFAYHGTGRELLNGSLKAALIFGFPVALLNVVPELLGARDAIKIASAILNYSIFMVFIPFAMVGARRYRLSRTSWRGIRFSFRGRALDFMNLFIGGSLLSIITLGLYYPIFEIRRHAFMVSHSYFGNQKFAFDGQGRDLFWSYVAALPLSLLTLGIYWFWFLAKKQRYLMEHTSFGTARFRSTVTGGRLFLFHSGNLLLLVCTLGLAWSWIQVRNMRFSFEVLSLEGPLNVAAIQQEAQLASATGEGLAGFLDMDFGLG